jgi:hypothetical protein
MRYIGIDPGVNGGMVVLEEDGSCWACAKMPATPRDLWDVLARWTSGIAAKALVEKLGRMPRDKNGKPMQSGTTMQVMGRNRGHIEMALIGQGIPMDEILPRQWQAMMGVLGDGKESRTQEKNRHKAKAQELFPPINVTLALSDALLLAECLRRMERRRSIET